MDNKNRCWVAVVVGFSEEHGQILASFLSFNAQNRFHALNEVKKLLPENPKWLAPGGELLDFRLFAFHQCDPSEVNGYASEYMGAFMEIFPQGGLDAVPGAVPA